MSTQQRKRDGEAQRGCAALHLAPPPWMRLLLSASQKYNRSCRIQQYTLQTVSVSANHIIICPLLVARVSKLKRRRFRGRQGYIAPCWRMCCLCAATESVLAPPESIQVTLDRCLTVRNKFLLIHLPPTYLVCVFCSPLLSPFFLRRLSPHSTDRSDIFLTDTFLFSTPSPKCLYAHLSQLFSFCRTTLVVPRTTIHLNLNATNFRHLFLSTNNHSCSRAQHENPLCCGKTCYCKVSSPDII